MLREILILFTIGVLLLSGLGAIATPVEHLNEYKTINIAFSQPVFKEENDYITVTFEEANSLLINENKPLLPTYMHTFLYPLGTKIKNVICEFKNIKSIELDKDIIPSPAKSITGTASKIVKNQYSYQGSYPDKQYDYNIKVGQINGEIQEIVTIEAFMSSYNKQEQIFSWAENVNIKVNYELKDQVTTTNADYEFIILTADEFSDELQALKTHKNNRGVLTEIFTLSQIKSLSSGRDDAEKVKNFIKDAIEQYNTQSVLLVGNRDLFPTRDTHIAVDNDNEIFVSDLYFADIYYYNEDTQQFDFTSWDSNENDVFAEYDWNDNFDLMDLSPDVKLGRLPANSGSEVTTVVNKIITYENSEAYTQDWFTDLVVVGGDSFISEQYDSNGILEGEYVNQRVINVMDGFIPEKIWVSLGKLNNKGDLNSALKSGCGFVDFSGHGNTNVYATHPHKTDNKWLPGPNGGFFSNDIKTLNNEEKLPIVITGACSVSKFSKDENTFSWSWLANDGGGSIASFGATGLGYAYIGTYVVSGLVEGMAIGTFGAYQDGAINVGEMWERALNNYMNTHSINDGGEIKTVVEWTLFGDPTLAISSDSIPPEKPERPDGKTNGGIDKEYTFTSTTTDLDDDELYYLFDWGDGTYSGWVGPYNSGQTASASHTWTTQGDYQIKVRAKDEHGVQSDWSEPLGVAMPKTMTRSIFPRLQENFPIIYQIIEKLFSI